MALIFMLTIFTWGRCFYSADLSQRNRQRPRLLFPTSRRLSAVFILPPTTPDAGWKPYRNEPHCSTSGIFLVFTRRIGKRLTAFGKENSASCLLLDNNGEVLGQFSFEDQLSGQFVSYAQKLLRSGQIYDDSEKPFRIQNGFHFPTRYVGLWGIMFLHDWETDGAAF